MGYKLAGFNVIGGVEIDPEMMGLYRKNLRPRISYELPIQDFKKRQNLQEELFNLDVLDGSPPCSSFSMAGSREKSWGKKKVFREGQADQVLDDLFFDFIDVAKLLRPKIVVSENVKGLLTGNARGYVKQIIHEFEEAEYSVQVFVLNSSRMGVPQARERSFFLARRSDLALPPIRLHFNEPTIPLMRAIAGRDPNGAKQLTKKMLIEWTRTPLGSSSEKYFQLVRPWPQKPCPTITSQCQDAGATVCHPTEPRKFSTAELTAIQTFPDDYDFGRVNAGYVMGMSVPPFMMQRVADQIRKQWL